MCFGHRVAGVGLLDSVGSAGVDQAERAGGGESITKGAELVVREQPAGTYGFVFGNRLAVVGRLDAISLSRAWGWGAWGNRNRTGDL